MDEFLPMDCTDFKYELHGISKRYYIFSSTLISLDFQKIYIILFYLLLRSVIESKKLRNLLTCWCLNTRGSLVVNFVMLGKSISHDVAKTWVQFSFTIGILQKLHTTNLVLTQCLLMLKQLSSCHKQTPNSIFFHQPTLVF